MDKETKLNSYIERFSKCHHITPEEAAGYAMVKQVKDYYEEEEEISK